MASVGQLDHAVLLLPYNNLINLPDWLTQNFTVSPGGRHADGKTENRLVLFRDGTYLELIAFINDDPEKRRGHWWDKPYGVVDFAFTTGEALDFPSLEERLKNSDTGISYGDPKEGGRVTLDGRELKWKVTFPKGIDRGNVPFWCHDITPRERRVPITDSNTHHQSGVLGMAGMLLQVKKESLERLSTAMSAIVDVSKHESNQYRVGVPNELSELKQPSIRLQERSQDSGGDLSLALILQTASHNPRDAIRKQIDGGVVSISFE